MQLTPGMRREIVRQAERQHCRMIIAEKEIRMSDSLILKYRPAALDQMLGQDAIARSLEEAAAKSTSQAFLFTSTVPGTGKTSAARIMAELMGCIAPFGIHEVDGATKNGIDDMRELQELLLYKPLNGGNLAIIVDECHAITAPAWKALLKSIEEPPGWVRWFLCTTEAGKVPSNIATRCAKFDFKPIKLGVLVELLEYIAAEENMTTPKSVVVVCAEEANGSARGAISNLVTCAACLSETEAAELLQTAAKSPVAFDLAKALLAGANWKEASALISKLGEVNAESVRMVILAYMTTVALTAKSDKAAVQAVAILDKFSQPFYPAEKLAPLVRTVGLLCLE